MESRDTVVYDGDCGICEASASWIIRHVPIVDVKSHREYGVSYLKSVWFIRRDARYEGAAAVAQILQLSDVPVARVCGRFMSAPLVRNFAEIVYWVIARNRAHISRLVGLKACGLPQNQSR